MKTPPEPRRASSRGGVSRTAWALAALASGLLLGVLLHRSGAPWAPRVADAVAPFGQLWVAALQMVVVPLILTQTFVAIALARAERTLGAVGVRALVLFVAMLVAGALLALALAPPLVSLYPVGADTAASLRSGVSIPNAPSPARGGPGGFGSWLASLVPKNIVSAASSGEILPLLLFAALFALAARRLAPERRELLGQLVQGLADATMVLVGWILNLAPIGVFALAFELTARAGAPVAGFMTAFIGIDSGLMLLFLVLLYPATALLGRISMVRFARAVAPAQLVAASTRSSLASLPALVQGAKRHLVLPPVATGFVLPLSVSLFKVNRTISATVKLFFLAHVFRVPLGPAQIVTFAATVILLSFSTLGIPSGGAMMRTLPAYLAAGVPLEGVVILDAVDAIPDIFKTLLNVTGDMSAAVLLSRGRARESRALADEAIA